MGGVKDGHVTMDEFINYYTNLSASIESEEYFELMIRNAWHISGGEGAAANTSNRRLLVTRPDGTQSVEEVKNDLGVRADDSAGMISRLRQQGVEASAVSAFNSAGDKDLKAFSSTATRRPSTASSVGQRRNSSSLPSPAIPPRSAKNTTSNSKAMVNAAVVSVYPALAAADPGIIMLVDKIKKEMKARGAFGFVGLQHRFKIMDEDGNNSLDRLEFRNAMRDLSVGLADSDIRLLFDYFDKDRSGSVDFDEFIQGVRDPLSDRRLNLVKQGENYYNCNNDFIFLIPIDI